MGIERELVPCRVCGHGMAEPLGEIPNCGIFAGAVVAPSIQGGRLWKCIDCASMFRYPTLKFEEYSRLYEGALNEGWDIDESQRNDFATVYAYLLTRAGGSVLDIGCYTGGFLADVPAVFRKHGLELSGPASDAARSKGICMLGKTLEDLDAGQVFDVVVAIDVVEHVLDVETFLAEALAHVKQDGALIISTGNPGSFAWSRVFKAKFWYCSNAEHLTFPSYNYYRQFAARRGLPAPEQILFTHRNVNLPFAVFYSVSQILFGISPAWFRTWRKMLRWIRRKTTPMPPDIPLTAPGIFMDHHTIIFRK